MGLRIIVGSPVPVPSETGVDACRPPVKGVIPQVLCGQGPARWPGGVGDWFGRAWPGAVGALALVAVLAGALWLTRWRRRSAEMRAGRWWEVIPPPVPSAAGGEVFWRLIATVQKRVASRPRWDRRRAVVGFEVLASGGRPRIGIWLPAGVPEAGVRAAVERAWEGARMRPRPVPVPPVGRSVAVRWARPAESAALPVADPTRRRARPDRSSAGEPDPLRAVFAEVVQAAAAGEWALVQVLTRPAGWRRIRWAEAQARPGVRRVSWLRRVALDVLDLVEPGPATPPTRGTGTGWPADPLAAERARAVAGKLAARPLWEVAVTVGVADGPKAGIRAGQVGAGLALVADATSMSCRTRRFGVRRLADRSPRRSAWWLARLPEVAALAHVPYSPGRAGVRSAAGRQVPPPPELYLADHGDDAWSDEEAA